MTTSASESRAGGAQPPNRRSQLKSDRRLQLLSAAERLFAERGFLAVRLEDIGASAGVSGPAIYRHFPNKESLLVELLVGISTRLLAGARQVRARSADAAAALDGLIDFHLDFALNEPDLIRIQDRDLAYLPKPAERQVRKAQRQYVEVWVGVLRELNPELAEADARLTAHAVFGLLNSTPHSMKSQDSGRGKPARAARSRAIMRAMTVAALAAGNQCP
ncbi:MULTISPECIES: SACE_7040 family transcriptional regulator [Mycobacterium avium complex (MAC)]|jgi:AcrR family transcriptional regulator|uniref:TetR/AcrR family transcriptional regulator n=4 Tax=Mycobacterium avium complex (MAC) TaxID=120793 RepID=A0A2A3LBE2_MYCAV|nr:MULTISPECIES: TetR/AcrR family transcriptional regulator [Mycobacterium avium complex (MAC)]ETA93294.1 TetR family transcriptional regulator [Mycobacterium avium 05-4293]ETB11166.1 TetR family transcriptional regulator [Mycobacterium avium subsp. silvaticum ATCC 49884]ETB12792.1 TetR family transcriptional regulator [Mycobacterium avium subsp. paratuberculosis 08-8281]ETB17975.1 TetR family transcriptional regulator [Mycobacterium avium subsp. avium 10-9275]ETB22219.1 TetR family transcript